MLKNKTQTLKKVFLFLLQLLFIALPFILMEGIIRVYAIINVNYMSYSIIIPACIFSFIWIVLLTLISYFLDKFWGRIFYGVVFAFNFILFLTHLVYHSYTGFFFRFNLLSSADEGSGYILETVRNANPAIYIASAIIIALAVLVIIKFPQKERINIKALFITLLSFSILNLGNPYLLGKANTTLSFNTWSNPRNIYSSFNDANKSMQICGMYEFTFKDLCSVFWGRTEKPNEEQLAFLKKAYSQNNLHNTNDKTGMFKGKNVIFLQLEGVDSWLLNAKNMPNTYSLLSESINFSNHYSYYTGGGSTFNSELAAITSFVTPISYVENPYAFHENSFDYSMPKVLKANGYENINAFHMNTGEYYVREINYANWGFDEYYGLCDDGVYTNEDFALDTELINNELFYDKMFRQSGTFANYVITYTVHMPFDFEGYSGAALANKLYGNDAPPQLGEEEMARLFAAETDEMVGLLMQALKDNGLYENTVIVAFADHYLYTLFDKTILDKYKETSNNLINHTPFFIWSHGVEPETIEKVNSQIDILPTVLNMLGIEYYDEVYVGHDVFDENYKGYVFFSDYSWYDGTHYVENGKVANGVKADGEYIAKMNAIINDTIRKNDLTLKYDYFKIK